ncbi:MAG: zinc-binding metallopeptidase family protein, partial [Lysobacterales bacterium]
MASTIFFFCSTVRPSIISTWYVGMVFLWIRWLGWLDDKSKGHGLGARTGEMPHPQRVTRFKPSPPVSRFLQTHKPGRPLPSTPNVGHCKLWNCGGPCSLFPPYFLSPRLWTPIRSVPVLIPGKPLSSKTPSNAAEPPLPAGRNYRCQCGQPVFFRNSRCLACDTPLGYDCERGILLPLMPGPQPDTWQEWQARSGETGAPVYKRCRDLSTPAACNWLIPVEDPQDMCRACRLNRTIPDLTDPAQPDNGYLWGLLEQAKRRLVSSLILLKLPVASRMSEDPERGLMFDFLRSPVNGPHVVTGHDTGLITLNVDEADDAKREAVRKTMREPYRTLLGHFRHEVGHYYWGRLIAGTPWLEGFHELFGDESVDYMASLQRSYYQGPPSDWPLHFVSAYASTHPWEDWAECWAHYLHMRDAIDTALSFGLSVD